MTAALAETGTITLTDSAQASPQSGVLWGDRDAVTKTFNRRPWSTWSPWLLLVALAVHGALPVPAAAAAQGDAGAPRRPVLPRGKRSGLEARVAKLTKALGLDAKQQAALRKLLLGQREQVQRIWSNESLPAPDRIVATRALSRQTAEQIRALLTEEQRKKYVPPPQGDRDPGNAIGNAHVEDWMKGAR